MLKFNQKLNTEDKDYHITSDLHFFHKNILKFCSDTRPWFDVDDMNRGLIEYWNDTVKPDDEIISLGDFSFGNKVQTQGILEQLHGNKTYVLGNHCKLFRNQLGLPYYDYLELRVNKTKVILQHYAPLVWNAQHYGSVALFGHSHGGLEGAGRSIDVGWDAHGKFLKLEEAVKMCLDKEVEVRKYDNA